MVSIIIPAFNEEGAINNTIANVKNVLNNADIAPYEVIVIDDGSTDSTSEEARESGAAVVTNPHNMGYGFSLKRGILAATYDTIIITDADMTYPFEYTTELINQYNKGFDLVVGQRTGKHYNESLLKMLLRFLLRKLVEFTAGRKIPDINSGLRIFSKKTITSYFNRLCDTFSFTTSQTLAYMMTGKFVKYVKIPYNKRKGKTKVRLFKDTVKTTQYIIEAAVYYNPLRIFSLFSIICIILAFIGFIVSNRTGIQIGYILGIVGLSMALVVFCAGLIAVLLKQIMDRPK
jgi:glycosyltransferase involved in cell wall biosynthesis